MVEEVTPVVGHERARLDQGADELLQVERISLGLPEHAAGQVFGKDVSADER